MNNPIIVLGGGPSGVVCSIGLRKLGYEVILLTKKRPFDALEGFSQRTIEGLKRGKCLNALKTITNKVKRDATWNNEKYDKNYEFIVERKLFDEALLQDAKEHGVEIIKSAGQIINDKSLTIKVMKKNLLLKASFIVDARGRIAPRNIQIKSKETVSLLIKYKNKNSVFKTSLSTCEHGWIWRASYGEDGNYLQLTTNPNEAKEKLKMIMNKNEKETISNECKIITREASSYKSKSIINNHYIRIGDAACAVDPLSGNGVFQALSTALISPYVINTLLLGSKTDKLAAKSFFKNRVDDIFYRYVRMGREFYALEKQFDNKFWTQRASWPDLKKYDESTSLNEVRIEKKAILIEPFIKAHEVVVTNKTPMGIWRLGRINLVYIVKELLEIKKIKREQFLQKLINNSDLLNKEKESLLIWCRENTLI